MHNFRSASIYFISVHVSHLTEVKKSGVKRKIGILFWAPHKKIPDPLGGELNLEQKVTASLLLDLDSFMLCLFLLLLIHAVPVTDVSIFDTCAQQRQKKTCSLRNGLPSSSE